MMRKEKHFMNFRVVYTVNKYINVDTSKSKSNEEIRNLILEKLVLKEETDKVNILYIDRGEAIYE